MTLAGVGADDTNEGHRLGECVEHVWRLVGATFAADGAHLEHVCDRCGGVMVQTPADLLGMP